MAELSGRQAYCIYSHYGVRTPRLFNIYMNDLSVLLNDSNIGGKIGGILVNHRSYADDMCLISLSSRGMSKPL